jgi:amino acid transporter
MNFGAPNLSDVVNNLSADLHSSGVLNILIVASITFVAFEGFQLVINAVGEMRRPERNIPRAIYLAVTLAVVIYLVISIGAVLAIPAKDIVANKEFALAAGAGQVLGSFGTELVILGAILATSSAIGGTLFGSPRQMAAVAQDGYLPQVLTKRRHNIPVNAVVTMAVVSSVLILVGGLELILEFGSITFLLISLLMAIANDKMRRQTQSSRVFTMLAIIALAVGGGLILYYEFTHEFKQMMAIVALYIILTFGALIFARRKKKKERAEN